MATLEKFRLLATQCGVAPSPTRSPATSPLVHVPRQKTTLRALFSRNPGPRGRYKAPRPRKFGPPESSGGGGGSRATLKDLFGLPTSFEGSDPEVGGRKRDGDGMVMVGGGGSRGLEGPGSPRAGFMGMRYRGLLRKAWRPMLETIQECDEGGQLAAASASRFTYNE